MKISCIIFFYVIYVPNFFLQIIPENAKRKVLVHYLLFKSNKSKVITLIPNHESFIKRQKMIICSFFSHKNRRNWCVNWLHFREYSLILRVSIFIALQISKGNKNEAIVIKTIAEKRIPKEEFFIAVCIILSSFIVQLIIFYCFFCNN